MMTTFRPETISIDAKDDAEIAKQWESRIVEKIGAKHIKSVCLGVCGVRDIVRCVIMDTGLLVYPEYGKSPKWTSSDDCVEIDDVVISTKLTRDTTYECWAMSEMTVAASPLAFRWILLNCLAQTTPELKPKIESTSLCLAP